MKTNIFLFFALLLISSCSNPYEGPKMVPLTQDDIKEMSKSETKEITKQLRHVVLFKFKENATTADIKKVEEAFAALPSKIKEIQGYEWGLNNSPEGLEKGFTN